MDEKQHTELRHPSFDVHGPKQHKPARRNTTAAYFERVVVKQQLLTSLHTHIHMGHVLMAEARHNVFKEPFSLTEDVVDFELMDPNEFSTVTLSRKLRIKHGNTYASARRTRRNSKSPESKLPDQEGLQILDKFLAEPPELVLIYNRFRRKHAMMAAGHINDYAALMQGGLEIIAQTLSTLEHGGKYKKESRRSKSPATVGARIAGYTPEIRPSELLRPLPSDAEEYQTQRRKKISSRSDLKDQRRVRKIKSEPHISARSTVSPGSDDEEQRSRQVRKSNPAPSKPPAGKSSSKDRKSIGSRAMSVSKRCISTKCCDSTELKHHMKVRFRPEHSRFADRFDVASEIFTGLMCRYEALLQRQLHDYAVFQVDLISAILDRLRTTLREVVEAETRVTTTTASNSEQQASTNVPSDGEPMTSADVTAMVERVVDRNVRKQKIYMMDFFAQLGVIKVGEGKREPSCCQVGHKFTEELPFKRHSSPCLNKQPCSIRQLFSLAVDEDMRKLITREVYRFLGPLQNLLHAHMEFIIRNQQRFSNLLLARLPPHSTAIPDAALTMTCCYQKRLHSLNMGTPYLTGCYLNGVSKHYENLRVLATEFYHNRLAELKARADKSRGQSSQQSSATQQKQPSEPQSSRVPQTTPISTLGDASSATMPSGPVTLASVFYSARKVVVKSMELINTHPRDHLVVTPCLVEIVGRVTQGCHQAARLRALCASLQDKLPESRKLEVRSKKPRSTSSGLSDGGTGHGQLREHLPDEDHFASTDSDYSNSSV